MKKITINLYKKGCMLRCMFPLFVGILIFAAIPVFASSKEDDSKIVRVGWFEGTYNTTGSNGERSGYCYEYQQALAAYTGWTYEYVEGDWGSLMQMLENGEIDLLSNVSYTEERAQTMLFSDLPMGEERYYLYADLSRTDISVSDLTTLNDKRVGMLEKSAAFTTFCEWEEKHDIHTEHVVITGAKDVHEKLADESVDLFVLNESPQWEQENLSAFQMLGSSYNYFVISKQRPDLKAELDRAMQRLEHDKPFYTDDLYKRYLSAKTMEVLADEESDWLTQHGAIRVGYLRADVGVSLVSKKNEDPVGIINDYIEQASNCMGDASIDFKLVGFNSQEKQLQALKDGKIDMIFHVNQNPFEAEQNGMALSNAVFESSVAVLTAKDHFDETAENIVAVSKGNLLSRWYLSYNYPQWKIREYESTEEVEKAVRNGEADCFIAKAGQTASHFEDSKIYSVFLTKMSYATFGVNKNDTTLLSILNKTLNTLPYEKLSGAYFLYENTSRRVTLTEFAKDNWLTVSIAFAIVFVIILIVILSLLRRTKRALQQAEKANEAKSTFLFNMSHDIRTPMNALLGYNELMKKELTDPKLLDYQEKIAQSGNILLSIINNVLDMARIENGKAEIDESYAMITDLSDKINSVFEMEAAKKGIHYSYEALITHSHIMCDVTKLQEIFVNLISNAVKYTPHGGTVTVRLQEMPSSKEGFICLKTEVIDTGIGMSKEFLPSLFVAFARERNTTAGKVAGTGLGMPIVKKYVDMMGGTIEVASELGKGTKFTVILPLRIADKVYYEERTEKKAETNMAETIRGKRILLAEDNDLNAEIAMTILEDMGLLVERVEDGIKCVAKIEQELSNRFDLILMDIQMPNMDGYKATQAIRRLSDKEKAGIPIIAMTANAFAEDRKKALEMGMNGHIAKPIDETQIAETLITVLQQTKE